jgi:hypothetical protein
MEALSSLGALFLLKGRLRTKTGEALAREVYQELSGRSSASSSAAKLALQLAGEVDGLRAQNEMLTDQLLATQEAL